MKFNLRDAWAAFFGGAQDAGVEIEGGERTIQARRLQPGETLAAVDSALLGQLIGVEVASAPLAAAVLPEAQAEGALLAAAIGGGAAGAPAGGGLSDAERAELEAFRAGQAAQAQARAQEAEAGRVTAAGAFADRMVAEARALPAERDAIAAAHLKAAQADGSGELLRAIEAMYTARPAHTLAQETIPTGPGATGGPADGVTEERRRALLALTPLGRAAAQRTRSA